MVVTGSGSQRRAVLDHSTSASELPPPPKRVPSTRARRAPTQRECEARRRHCFGPRHTAAGPAENIVLQAPRLVRAVGAFGGHWGIGRCSSRRASLRTTILSPADGREWIRARAPGSICRGREPPQAPASSRRAPRSPCPAGSSLDEPSPEAPPGALPTPRLAAPAPGFAAHDQGHPRLIPARFPRCAVGSPARAVAPRALFHVYGLG